VAAPLSADPRLKQVRWRDLVPLSRLERVWELTLSLPWLLASLMAYHHGLWWLGAPCSFFFFLTGLRQSHNAQHYALGIGRRWHDGLLFLLSGVMLSSMHAVQVTHLHHHRHCLDEHDIEAAHVRKPWWRVLLEGPLFPLRLHTAAWRLASPGKRRWVSAELGLIAGVIAAALLLDVSALRWHVAAMLAGECMTAFFAVYIVHRGCDAEHHIARTQRGWLRNFLSYSMFYHLEHHLFPAVPTCHLPHLAKRVDAVAPEYRSMQVLPA
jgi:fatty acid desaturase